MLTPRPWNHSSSNPKMLDCWLGLVVQDETMVVVDHCTQIMSITEELFLLGYNALNSGETQLTFKKNISVPSSGLKSKQT
jgi:hypothetical protein